MIVGIPKEVKVRESRVGLPPAGVSLLRKHGHQVYVEKSAGEGAGISDQSYLDSGAEALETADEVWDKSQLIVKVKEPIEQEFHRIKEEHLLFTYLHLAAVPTLTKVLLDKGCASVAYETIQLADNSLPLLKPMSEIAGRVSAQVGAQMLQKHVGGKGLLLGGVPGVARGNVCVLGAGVAGMNAAQIAVGLGARVTILDLDPLKLEQAERVFGNSVETLYSTPETIERTVKNADLLISCVLLTGKRAPMLVSEDLVKAMEPGSAIVDVSIDQGGAVATIKPTTHDEPIYQKFGVNHYGVTNIPGDVPRTSTWALASVTTPYLLKLANKGLKGALQQSPALQAGLNTYQGKLTNLAVAETFSLPYTSPDFLNN
jgi:alanine dehydrogenase